MQEPIVIILACCFEVFITETTLCALALACNDVRLLLLDTMILTSRQCLNKFVALTPDLYGTMHVSYNGHLLSHLPDTVHNWGPLWSHSPCV